MRITSILRRGDGKNPSEGTHCLLLRACNLCSLTGIVLPRRPLPLLKTISAPTCEEKGHAGHQVLGDPPPEPGDTPLQPTPPLAGHASVPGKVHKVVCQVGAHHLDLQGGE